MVNSRTNSFLFRKKRFGNAICNEIYPVASTYAIFQFDQLTKMDWSPMHPDKNIALIIRHYMRVNFSVSHRHSFGIRVQRTFRGMCLSGFIS